MSSSSYFFTTLNALPIIMVATEKTSQPWEPSPYCTESLLYGAEKRSFCGRHAMQPPAPAPAAPGDLASQSLLSRLTILVLHVPRIVKGAS